MSRSMLVALSLGMLALAPMPSDDLPPQQLPVYGGADGTAFTRSCGAGKVLTGLRYRAGVLVDAVGLRCRPVNSNGQLGSETSVGTLAGGSGGTSGSRSCPAGTVVADVMIHHGSFVDGITFYCRTWDAASRKFVGGQKDLQHIGGLTGSRDTDQCEAPTQPANGIRGRAGSLVDAIGFICDEP